MHEMSLVKRIVDIAVRHALDNGCHRVDKIVVQVGQLSGVVPEALQHCYHICAEGTIVEEAGLEIEYIPARVVCVQCSHDYEVVKAGFSCPLCDSHDWNILSGKEFVVKEIEGA